ncbi:hypothetical protein Tco_0596593 [Tanacetum coccineum]
MAASSPLAGGGWSGDGDEWLVVNCIGGGDGDGGVKMMMMTTVRWCGCDDGGDEVDRSDRSEDGDDVCLRWTQSTATLTAITISNGDAMPRMRTFRETVSPESSSTNRRSSRKSLCDRQRNMSSTVTTTDESNKRQQQPDSTSSTSTLAITVTANGNFDL